MAERTFFVKKGWLIAKDAFGNMLPFFLHVRDKDIVWQSKNDDFLKQIVKNRSIKNVEEISPKKLIRYSMGNWNVTVDYERHLCTMRTRIDFTEDMFKLNSNKDNLHANLSLPLALKDDDALNIQCHLSTEVMQIATSSISACKLLDGATNMIHNLSINLFNNTYKFPSAFYNQNEYQYSSIYVEVVGTFTDY